MNRKNLAFETGIYEKFYIPLIFGLLSYSAYTAPVYITFMIKESKYYNVIYNHTSSGDYDMTYVMLKCIKVSDLDCFIIFLNTIKSDAETFLVA